MSLLAMFNSAGPTGFGYGSTAEQVAEGLSLAGQTILVTGCNSGIGQETCRVLALRGALGAWDGAHQRRRLRLRARRSRQGGRLLLRAFRSFVCARVQRRANTFRHAPTSISRMQRDWLRYGPSASRYARGFEMKLAGKPSSPGLARSQHRFGASVSVFQSSSS